jgi:hypothetical protein
MQTIVLSEQIDPRILEALFANFPSPEIVMLELTDNAIGDRIPGKKMILTLRVRKDLVRIVMFELTSRGYGPMHYRLGLSLPPPWSFLTFPKVH